MDTVINVVPNADILRYSQFSTVWENVYMNDKIIQMKDKQNNFPL